MLRIFSTSPPDSWISFVQEEGQVHRWFSEACFYCFCPLGVVVRPRRPQIVSHMQNYKTGNSPALSHVCFHRQHSKRSDVYHSPEYSCPVQVRMYSIYPYPDNTRQRYNRMGQLGSYTSMSLPKLSRCPLMSMSHNASLCTPTITRHDSKISFALVFIILYCCRPSCYVLTILGALCHGRAGAFGFISPCDISKAPA